jgi:large subunit ribosomal protein L21
MYAVIESGGRQFKVEAGDVIDVEREDHLTESAGSKAESKKTNVLFDRVLLLSSDDGSVKVGSPTIEGAKVTGVLVDEVRGPKLLVFKKKRRKGYKRLRGHRQDLHRVKIEKIEG